MSELNKEIKLVEFEESKVVAIFTTKDGIDNVLKKIKSEIDCFNHDMSTALTRAKTKKFCALIGKFKTRVEENGKLLVKDWKEKSAIVDSDRKYMRDELDKLKVTARKELTEWEEKDKEKKRLIAIEKEKAQALADFENCHTEALLLNIIRNTELIAKNEKKQKEHDAIKKQAQIDAEIAVSNDMKLKLLEEKSKLALAEEREAKSKVFIDNLVKESERKLADVESAINVKVESIQEQAKLDSYSLIIKNKDKIAEIKKLNESKRQAQVDADNKKRKEFEMQLIEKSKKENIQRIKDENEKRDADLKLSNDRDNILKKCKGVKNSLINELGIDSALAVQIVKKVRAGKIEFLFIDF